jgi:uncharacterized protein (TIGR03546 family)
MLLPGFISKLLAVFRGSVAPPLIFLTVMFGFWFGLMPGWSGLHVALLIIALIVNLHIGLFLLSLGVGKALCFSAAPLLYYVGVWVRNSLDGLLTFLASVPIVGITDFSRFALAGALVLGPVIGAIAGLGIALSVVKFRYMMLHIDRNSERFRKWYSNPWVRVLDRLLVGKRAKDVQSMFKKPVYIRKAGVVLAVLVVGGFLAAAHFLASGAVKDYTTEALTRTNGAEVDLAGLDISLLGGRVSADDLQVTDANKPQQNELVIEKVTSDAGMYDLTLGRLVMETVELSGMKFDQPRQSPGKVIEKPAKEEPFDPCSYDTKAGEVQKLDKYVKDAGKLKEWLQKVRDWLPSGKEKPSAEPQKAPEKYLEFLDARAITPPSARVWAKQVRADDVAIPSALFGNSEILLTNLSDVPQSLDEPVTFTLKSHETPAILKVTIDYAKPGSPEVSGTFEGFDLGKMQSALGEDAGIAFQSGLAGGTFTGQLTQEQMDLTIKLTLKNLQATGQGDGVLGLGANETTEIMQALNELSTTIRAIGPTMEPRLVFDTEGLSDQFKQALAKAGKDRLMKEVDTKLQEQLGEQVPEELKGTIEKPAKDIVEGLGGLLGGKKEEKKKE